MSSEKFDSLSSLHPGRYDWKIKVRIARKWESIQKKTGELKGYNMILVDDKNTRKHAFVGETYLKKFNDTFEEGKIYIIQNFNVKTYSEKEKHHCFKDDDHIFLSSYTEESEYNGIDPLIPENVFGFYDISELSDVALQSNFLVDVIGYAQKFEDPRHFINKNNEQQSYVKFDLSDGRHTVKVTMWDAFGDSLFEAYQKIKEEPIILIISSCKVNIWEKIVSLSNYPATRFFFNYKHHSVSILQARYNDPTFRSTQMVPRSYEPDPKKTVAEIKEFIPETDEMNVVCEVTINRITNKQDWYYSICCGCSKELERFEGKFKCDDCNKIEPYPDMRFRVCTLASDRTGAIGIILYDREVRRLTGQTVFEIEVQQLKDGTVGQFPTSLLSLENLPCTITLRLKKSQSQKKTNVFHADDLFVGCKEECSSPSIQGNTYIDQQPSISEGTVTNTSKSMLKKTPETLKSTNKTKGKKRVSKSIPKVNLSDDSDRIPLALWATQDDDE